MNLNHKFVEASTIAHENRDKLSQAEAYFWQKNVAEAAGICHQIIKDSPSCAEAYKLLGNILLTQGKIPQASRCYETAIEMNPQFAEAYANLGSIAYQEGDLDRSIAHYKKALEVNPSLTGVYSNLAKVLQEQGKKQEAIALQEHLATPPNKQVSQDDWISYFKQGNTYTAEGKLDRAIEFYQKALELNPNYQDSYLNLGIVLRRQGKLEEAIAQYEKAIEIQPSFADAYLSLGNIYCQLAEYPKVRDLWQKALELQPEIGGADVQFNLGNALVHLNEIERAIEQYHQALELDANCFKAYYNLANLFSNQGKIQEAIAAYKKTLAIDPQFIDGYLSLGELFEDLERYDEAIGTYLNIFNIQFHESLTFHKLGKVMTKKGHLNDAQIFYSRNIPINLFKKYSPMAQSWGFTSKNEPNNQSTYIDVYPRSFHYLSPPQTTDEQLDDLFKETHFTCPPASVTVVPDGRICVADYFNKTVFNSEDNLLVDISTGNLFWLSYEQNVPELQYVDETVAYISVKCLANYYHWMSDVLPRLELIRQSGIPFKAIDKFIINPTGLPIQPETLNILGIPPEKIWVSEDPIHLKAKELIIPSLTGSIWYMSKWVCNFLRQQFLPLAKPTEPGQPQPEKIYICRESKYRRILNEAEVIAALRQEGFAIVRLESLSLLEQVALFAAAKVVISPHGSGLTNIVFCQPGTKVLEIFPSTYVVRFYWKLSNLVDLDYYYLISELLNAEDSSHQNLQNSPKPSDEAYEDFIINIENLFKLMKLAQV